MKNRFLNILLSFIFGMIIIFPQITYADETADEDSACADQVEKQLNDNIKSALNTVNGLLNFYNKLAQQYISSCNQIIDMGTPVEFSEKAKAAADVANNGSHPLLTADYSYTGIIWSQEDPENMDCNVLKARAQQAKLEYNHARSRLGYMIDLQENHLEAPRKCVCSENAEDAECYVKVDTEDEPKESDSDCPLFSEYLSSLAKCPFCAAIRVILQTDGKIAQIAWRNIAHEISKAVLAIFFALLALETLKSVSNIAGSELGSYLKNILILGSKVAITIFILNDPFFIYKYFVGPVIKGGLDMGLAILSTSSTNVCDFTKQVITEDTGVLAKETLNKVYNAVECFNHSALIMPAIGRGLICHGWVNDGSILPDLSMWLAGLINYGFGLIIWIALIFYFIDCTIQIGFLGALLPLFIACWPFKTTQRYSFAGVKMLMNVFFDFVMIGVLMAVGLEIVGFATTGGTASSVTLVKLLNSAEGDNIQLLKTMTDLDTEAILILVACCVYAMKLISKTNSIAASFSGGAGSNFGSKMGGTVASAATSTAVATGKSLAKGTGRAATSFASTVANSSAGQALGQAARGFAQRQYNKVPLGARRFISKTGNAARQTYNFVSHADTKLASSLGKAVGLGKFQNQYQGSGIESPSTQQPMSQPNQTTSTNSGTSSQQPEKPTPNNQENGHQITVDNNGVIHDTYQENGQILSHVQNHADGSKDVEQFHKNGNKSWEFHEDANGSVAREYYENGQLKSERVNDSNGNGHYHSFNEDGSVNFKNEWKNDSQMAQQNSDEKQ